MDQGMLEQLKAAGIDPAARRVFPQLTVTARPGGALHPVATEPEFLVGATRVNLRMKPIRELFTGTRQPPPFAAGPPPAYERFFLLLERTLLTCCEAAGRDERDVEMERVYAQLRRRPDGKDANPVWGQLRAAAQYYMSVEDVSQAEFEGVVGRLARSARTAAFGATSTNYVTLLRQTIVVPRVDMG
jgi:hypothetical protein